MRMNSELRLELTAEGGPLAGADIADVSPVGGGCKQHLAITETQFPGLMNATTPDGGDIRDDSPRQRAVFRGEIPAQFAVHPQQAPCLASMARFFRES